MSHDPEPPQPPRSDNPWAPPTPPSATPPPDGSDHPGPDFTPMPPLGADPYPVPPGASPPFGADPYPVPPGTTPPPNDGVGYPDRPPIPDQGQPGHMAPGQWGSPQVPAKPTSTSPAVIGTWIAIGVAFVSSFLPWVTIFGISATGTQGDGDGRVTAALTAGAAIAFGIARANAREVRRGLVIASMVAMAVTLYLYVHNLRTITRMNNLGGMMAYEQLKISPGIGLYLGAIASVIAIITLVLVLVEKP